MAKAEYRKKQCRRCSTNLAPSGPLGCHPRVQRSALVGGRVVSPSPKGCIEVTRTPSRLEHPPPGRVHASNPGQVSLAIPQKSYLCDLQSPNLATPRRRIVATLLQVEERLPSGVQPRLLT